MGAGLPLGPSNRIEWLQNRLQLYASFKKGMTTSQQTNGNRGEKYQWHETRGGCVTLTTSRTHSSRTLPRFLKLHIIFAVTNDDRIIRTHAMASTFGNLAVVTTALVHVVVSLELFRNVRLLLLGLLEIVKL